MLHGPNQRSYVREWFGTLPQREQLAVEMSPLHYVRADLPPILTLHGDSDKTVPYSHALRLHAALDKAGAKNQLFTAVKGGHGDFSPADEARAWATIWQFLGKQGLMPSGVH
jgi:dipeptidyl aminopeptidase/acylaminoacyl peptidase